MPLIRRVIRLSFPHTVIFTHGALRAGNPVLARVFSSEGGTAASVLLAVDGGLAKARPELLREIKGYFSAHPKHMELAGEPLMIPAGEAAKNNWKLVERLWAAIERQNLSRQSYVLAVGGGAALDLAGFAAATAHRGLRLVRMPTTSLSQADGGVGVKNGVNYFGKKNWVGAFAVPAAVINDLEFMKTLPDSAARGGVVEAFKVGLIRDRRLADFIASHAKHLVRRDKRIFEKVIIASARLHLRHIATGGDPFEIGSARPLDYGHWLAHKLEQMSNFRLAHGDAVAVGLAIDSRYAAARGWLNPTLTNRIVQTLEILGCDTGSGKYNPLVRRMLLQDGGKAVLAGLEEFRQHLGGALALTMLRGWGRGMETGDIDQNLMRRVILDSTATR